MIHGAVIKETVTGQMSIRLYNVFQEYQENKICELVEDSLSENEELVLCERLDSNIKMVGDMMELDTYVDWCDEYIKRVCAQFILDESLLRSTYRGRKYSDFRFICFYVIRENTPLTLNAIGAMFNKRDHSTVINGLRKFNSLFETDIEFRFRAEKCKSIFFNLKSEHNG